MQKNKLEHNSKFLTNFIDNNIKYNTRMQMILNATEKELSCLINFLKIAGDMPMEVKRKSVPIQHLSPQFLEKLRGSPLSSRFIIRYMPSVRAVVAHLLQNYAEEEVSGMLCCINNL